MQACGLLTSLSLPTTAILGLVPRIR